MESAVNPDLAVERKATFNVQELTNLVDGSEEKTKERHRIEKILSDDPNLPNPFTFLELSADEYYAKSLQAADYQFEMLKANGLEFSQISVPSLRQIIAPYYNPKSMHNNPFRGIITQNGDDQQLKEWIPLIINQKISGSLAQTELGHGSDIKNLETTAIYDEKTEEFIVNSPSLTSTKHWAGGLGRTATHAVVVAQLCTKNKWFGIHMFIVPVRDVKDSSILPGVTVGEMGPRMNFAGLDNGFLRLNNVRIPRKNMLMKYTKVSKDGTYTKTGFDRANYGLMVSIRVLIARESAMELAMATTIAVRYNVVRRQGKIEKGGDEVKILDYKTQQYKLIPQVALAYALHFTAAHLTAMHAELMSKYSDDAAKLNEFHSIAAAMKAFSTSKCAEGSEICRRACGGLGYLQATRLPSLCTGLLASCTYEGDNTILFLQTSRYLMKSVGLIKAGKPIGESVLYLKEKGYSSHSCMLEYVKLFEATSCNLVNEVYKRLNGDINAGNGPEVAWQNNTIDLVKCSEMHAKVIVIQYLHQFLLNTQLSTSLREVLEKLFQLLAVYWIVEDSGDFIQNGKISIENIKKLRYQQLPQFLKDLRVNIVPLVDAFDLCDAGLQSVIGCYDGRAYERVFEYWTKLPSNVKQKQKKINKMSNL